jgi:hypothetical protein
MAELSNGSNGSNRANGARPLVGTDRVKQGLAQMLKGGVIVSCILVCCYLESSSLMAGFKT